MAPTPSRPQELTLPAASLAALQQALAATAGPDAAATALRHAGHAAGDAFFRLLNTGDTGAAAAPADQFWRQLSALFATRGWGQLTYAEVHSGVGALDAADWAEAVADGAAQPSCHFTTGLLANLLGQVAGGEVAVLEVRCRSRGDRRCRFLFGGTDAVFRVYDRIAAGSDADTAVAQLG